MSILAQFKKKKKKTEKEPARTGGSGKVPRQEVQSVCVERADRPRGPELGAEGERAAAGDEAGRGPGGPGMLCQGRAVYNFDLDLACG